MEANKIIIEYEPIRPKKKARKVKNEFLAKPKKKSSHKKAV